jgi:hypothetical protein
VSDLIKLFSSYALTHERLTIMVWTHFVQVVMQKGELDMVWTIMQKKKSKNAYVPTQQANMTDAYQSPSPTWAAQSDAYQFHFDEDINERNLDLSTPLQHIHSSTPVQHKQAPPSLTSTPIEAPESGRGKKKQKAKSSSPDEGFHEKYLKLKREEIDLFTVIEEKKLEDPYSINKCITLFEGLNGIQMGDILMSSDIFKNKDNMKVFLSFTSDALRLA